MNGLVAIRSLGARKLTIRLERAGLEVIVSPLLGHTLCETCWRARRAATIAPKALEIHASVGEALMDAFEKFLSSSGGPVPKMQRIAIGRQVSDLIDEANAAVEDSSGLPTLKRVDQLGLIRQETVLPLPHCQGCRFSKNGMVRKTLGHILGRHAGVISGFKEITPVPGEPDFPRVTVATFSNSFLDPDWIVGTGSSGKGYTLEHAVESALGEAMERYAASTIAMMPHIHRFSELDNAISSTRFTGLTSHGPETELPWVVARNIRSDVKRLVPASTIYFRWPASWDRFSRPTLTTSGLAAAGSLKTAIHRAFSEVVERHLFFLTWYGCHNPEMLKADEFLAAEHLNSFTSVGLRVRTMLLGSVAGVFVSAACCSPVKWDGDRPGFALGLGTGSSIADAVQSSFLELGQVYRGLTWALSDNDLRSRAKRLASGELKVETPFDHGLLFSQRSIVQIPKPFGEAARNLHLNYRVVSEDPEAYFVDLTPRDLMTATGWRIVRVVIPDFIPFHAGRISFPSGMFAAFERGALEYLGPHPLS